ncbi:MAG TPA: response regulator, partial [Moraxellaceae bacterium]|nr:response regulator [Moraxellaceae bacterium]
MLVSNHAFDRVHPFLPMPRILAIEDDETTANEIVAELEGHGFSVTLARNGQEGLRCALQGEFDAITLDRMLPGLDGLDVVSALRNAG